MATLRKFNEVAHSTSVTVGEDNPEHVCHSGGGPGSISHQIKIKLEKPSQGSEDQVQSENYAFLNLDLRQACIFFRVYVYTDVHEHVHTYM